MARGTDATFLIALYLSLNHDSAEHLGQHHVPSRKPQQLVCSTCTLQNLYLVRGDAVRTIAYSFPTAFSCTRSIPLVLSSLLRMLGPASSGGVFDAEYTELFPNLPDSDMPGTTLAMHQSPDKSMYWLAGREGLLLKVSAACSLFIWVYLVLGGCPR